MNSQNIVILLLAFIFVTLLTMTYNIWEINNEIKAKFLFEDAMKKVESSHK